MIDNILTEILKQVELVNKRAMAQTVEDENINIQFDPDGVIKNLSNLSKEDQQTPELLIESMCKQYTEIKTTDIFLDACCGRGAMLVYLHTYYNIPKDQLYGIEIKEENVRLLNKLGYHNIILGDILDNNTWAKLYDRLSYNIKGGDTMKFNKVIMNPPYSGNLHLKILEKVLQECKPEDGCEVVNLSPARWIQDPLAEYKQGSDKKRYENTIINKLADLKIISCAEADLAFGIHSGVDLGIYTFKNTSVKFIFESLSTIEKSIFNKIIKNYCKVDLKNTIAYYQDKNKIDGIRIKCVTILHGAPRTSSRADAANIYYLTDEPLIDGKNKDGKFFTELTAQSKTKNTLPVSIKFKTITEAQNYLDSLKTNFIKNLVRLVVWDVHVPNTAIPWMHDYTHAWTDNDFCTYFNLTPEETAYMKRV